MESLSSPGSLKRAQVSCESLVPEVTRIQYLSLSHIYRYRWRLQVHLDSESHKKTNAACYVYDCVGSKLLSQSIMNFYLSRYAEAARPDNLLLPTFNVGMTYILSTVDSPCHPLPATGLGLNMCIICCIKVYMHHNEQSTMATQKAASCMLHEKFHRLRSRVTVTALKLSGCQ